MKRRHTSDLFVIGFVRRLYANAGKRGLRPLPSIELITAPHPMRTFNCCTLDACCASKATLTST